MIITTTPNGRRGIKLLSINGLFFWWKLVAGVDAIKDIAAGLRNFLEGRSRAYEGELSEAGEEALQEMEERATKSERMLW